MIRVKSYISLGLFLFLFLTVFLSSTVSFSKENPALSNEITMAKGFFKDGLYHLAIKELDEYKDKGVAKDESCAFNLSMGKSYYFLERYSDAALPLSAVLEEGCLLDEDESAYYYLGDASLKTGRVALAKKKFEDLKRLYPKSSFSTRVNESLGQIIYLESLENYENRRYKKALAGFFAVLRVNPKDIPLDELHAKRGDSFFYLERYDNAERAYRKSFALLPAGDLKGRVQFQLAFIKYYLEEYDKSISLMQSFLDEYPKHPLANKGENAILWSLYKKEKYKEALSYLEDLHDEEKKLPDSEVKDTVNASSRLIMLGEYAEAAELMEEALARFGKDPLHGELMLLLAEAYKGSGRDDLEEMTHREIIKRYADSVASKKALFSLGNISFKKGLFEASVIYFREYLEQDSLGAFADGASYHLAESFFKLGKMDEAKTNYSSLIEKYRDSDFLIPSRLRLADIEALSGKYLSAAKLYSSLAGKAPSKDREDIIWKMAGFYMKAEAFKSAHKAYRDYIKKYPESDRVKKANLFLGEIEYLSGNYKKGIKRFSKIVDVKGKGGFLPENALRLAWGYIKLNQMPDALKILDLIIEKYPKSEESATAYYLKGWLAQEGNRLKKANKEYRKLLNKFEGSPVEEDVKWQIGVNQFILGEYKGAIKSFKSFSKDFPDSYRAGDMMVRKSYSALGDFKKALESSPAFFDGSPDKTVDLKKRCDEAIALFEVGSYRDALKLAETIIERFPSQVYSARVMLMMGEIYLKKGMIKKATQHFLMVKDILKVGLLRRFASFRLGSMAFRAKDFRGAVMELEGISPLVSSDSVALEELKVFIDPSYMMAMTLYLRGSAYLRLNHVEKALNDYRNFLDVYPLLTGLSMERLKAALAFQQHKDYDQAIKSMRETMAVSDETKIKAEAQYWIGESYQGSGDLEQAIVEFLKVTYLYPSEGMWALTAKYMAAQAYQELGQYENAIKLFNKVAKESGDKRKREYARKKVKELAKMIEAPSEVIKD